MKLKKIMALALAATLALSMLAGCQDGSSSSGTTGGSTGGGNTSTDPGDNGDNDGGTSTGGSGDNGGDDSGGNVDGGESGDGEDDEKEVTLNTIGDAALTDEIAAELRERGFLDDTKKNVSCSYENSIKDREPMLSKLYESWDVGKIITIGNNEIGSNHLTQEILKDVKAYKSLQDDANRESLFEGDDDLYLDGIVVSSDVDVNSAVNAVAAYLESYSDPSGEKSLKDLPDSCDGSPRYYNFAFKIASVSHSGNKAYVVFIIIDVRTSAKT